MINCFSFASVSARSVMKFSTILGLLAFSSTGYSYSSMLQKTSGCFSQKTVADGNDSVFKIWYELEQSTKSSCSADFIQQNSVSILVQPDFFEEVFFSAETSQEDYWSAIVAAIAIDKNVDTSGSCESLDKVLGFGKCQELSGLIDLFSVAGCCSLREDISSLALLSELLHVLDEKQTIRFFMQLAHLKNPGYAHQYFSIRFQTRLI